MKRKDLGVALHKDRVWFSFQAILDFQKRVSAKEKVDWPESVVWFFKG